MSLSKELISRFAKVIQTKQDKKKETTQYGTVVINQNGKPCVKLDGSDYFTPISTVTDVADGDRVTVLIKNHTATVTGNLSHPSAKDSKVTMVYDTATGAVTTATNAQSAATNAQETANNASNKATNAQGAASDAANAANAAAKTATNYLYYDADGLQIGDKTSGSWRGFRARIKSTAYEIVNEAGNILASYGANLVELGKNAASTIITFCGGKGKIEYDSIDEYLQLNADNVRLKGNDIASVYSTYTDETTRWEKSAVNVKPKQVHLYSEECIDPTMVEHTEGWKTSEVDITPDKIRMSSEEIELNGALLDPSIDGKYLSCRDETYGIWRVRSWSDGTMELWGIYEVENRPCTITLGSMYRTDVLSIPDFPMRVNDAVLTASYESNGYGAMLWATTNTSIGKPPSYYLIRPTSSAGITGQIHLYVRGTWK